MTLAPNMEFTLLVYLAPLLVKAAAVPEPRGPAPPLPTAFTVVAHRHGSPIDNLPIQASGLRFRLGGEAATFCPDVVKDCPPGAVTPGLTLTRAGRDHARWSFEGFDANGFMACPSADRSFYQLFAAMKNATVPTGNVHDYLKFRAIATAFTGGFAAWQYT